MLAFLLACHPDAGHHQGRPKTPSPTTDDAPTTDTSVPTTPSVDPCAPTDVAVTGITLSGQPSMVLAETLTATLSAPARVAFACRNEADPADTHLLETDGAVTATATIVGLLPDAHYDCAVAPVCPRSTAAPASAGFPTGSLPATMPTSTVTRDQAQPMKGGAYTLVSHSRWCSGDTQRILAYDPDGRIRWYDELPYGDLNVGIEPEYLGAGRFFWGGGDAPDGAPQIDDVFAQQRYKAAFPGSSSMLFNHDARAKWVDPTTLELLSLHYTTDSDDYGNTWTGFGLVLNDLADNVLWRFGSQQAFDQGALPASCCYYDAYHGNAIDLEEVDGRQVAYVSMYYLALVMAVDVADSTVLWRFGAGGDFALFDPSGNPLSDDHFMQGEHGIDFDDDQLVVYDNGYFRGYSRAVGYTLDPVAHTATEDWVWTDPGWYESILGDVDWIYETPTGTPAETPYVGGGPIKSGHVLVDEAHSECASSSAGRPTQIVEVDTATGGEVWRLVYDDVQDDSYRAQRVDLCDITGDVTYCPEAAAELTEVASSLGW